MEPRDLVLDSMTLNLDTPEGISSWYEQPAVVMADDTVRRLSKAISREELRAALTVNDGAKIDGREGLMPLLPDGRNREKKP